MNVSAVPCGYKRRIQRYNPNHAYGRIQPRPKLKVAEHSPDLPRAATARYPRLHCIHRCNRAGVRVVRTFLQEWQRHRRAPLDGRRTLRRQVSASDTASAPRNY